MSPSKPGTPDQGKPEEETQIAQTERERSEAEAKEAAAVEAAADSERERSEASPKRRRRKAAPEAEGTAAVQTGVDKPVAGAAKLKRRSRKSEATAETADADTIDTADSETVTAEASESEAPETAPKPRRARRKAEPEKPAAPASKTRRAARDYGDNPPMVRAHAKYVRTSARKARLVCDHIRGKSVEEARAILAHANRDVARDWSKLLESAVANAEHNHELIGDELRIAAVKADEGPTLKRFRPRAMGRATKIRKRTSHLSITLTPKDGE